MRRYVMLERVVSKKFKLCVNDVWNLDFDYGLLD